VRTECLVVSVVLVRVTINLSTLTEQTSHCVATGFRCLMRRHQQKNRRCHFTFSDLWTYRSSRYFTFSHVPVTCKCSLPIYIYTASVKEHIKLIKSVEGYFLLLFCYQRVGASNIVIRPVQRMIMTEQTI
jgi:hypothetical protein